jgi:hypothetical protein
MACISFVRLYGFIAHGISGFRVLLFGASQFCGAFAVFTFCESFTYFKCVLSCSLQSVTSHAVLLLQ